MEKKQSLSTLKRKIQEKVKRAEEPFRGTLVLRKRAVPTSIVEEASSNTLEKESDDIEKESVSFGKNLRKRIESRDEPFLGSLGKLYK